MWNGYMAGGNDQKGEYTRSLTSREVARPSKVDRGIWKLEKREEGEGADAQPFCQSTRDTS